MVVRYFILSQLNPYWLFMQMHSETDAYMQKHFDVNDSQLQKVFGLWFFGWNSSALLRCCLEYDEISMQMVIQLKDGCHIAAPGNCQERERTPHIVKSIEMGKN